jgi:hypothetical protein
VALGSPPDFGAADFVLGEPVFTSSVFEAAVPELSDSAGVASLPFLQPITKTSTASNKIERNMGDLGQEVKTGSVYRGKD